MTSSRRRRWVWGGLAVAFLAATLLLRWLMKEPSMFVTVRQGTDGAVVVEWARCGSRTAAPEYAASVFPEGLGNREFECTVVPANGMASLPALNGSWSYGNAPSGYSIEGRCPRLVPGRRYRASVGGRIGGSAGFVIGDDGQVKVVSRSCDWWDDL